MNQARVLDEKAKGLAKHYLQTEGELLSVLIEMRRHRVFAELNFSGIFDYCENRLRLSRAQSYYLKSVAEKSELIPEIKDAIDQGDLSLSQARRIIPVITPENKDVWIEKAKTLPQLDLEGEVTNANPKAHPKEKLKPIAPELSELRVPVEKKTEENLTVLKNLLSQKLKRPATLKEVIAWMSEVCREKFDPEKKAERAKSKDFLGNPPTPGRHPIPAAIRHEVVKQKGFQCHHVSADGRRCLEKRWLQFHHCKPVAQGGLNTIENLILLCSNHHRFTHGE